MAGSLHGTAFHSLRRHRRVLIAMRLSAVFRRGGLALGFVAATAPALADDAQTWQLDPARSRIDFELAALGVVRLHGNFERFHSEIQAEPGGGYRIQLVIDADSLSMTQSRYQSWARSPEFFDVEQHPEVTFLSAPVASVPIRSGDLDGKLTLRGITRPVRFRIEPLDCPPDSDDCIVSVRGEIDRRQFGMRSRRMTLSNQVRLDMTFAVARLRLPD